MRKKTKVVVDNRYMNSLTAKGDTEAIQKFFMENFAGRSPILGTSIHVDGVFLTDGSVTVSWLTDKQTSEVEVEELASLYPEFEIFYFGVQDIFMSLFHPYLKYTADVKKYESGKYVETEHMNFNEWKDLCNFFVPAM
jgi:hypothetical protein